MTKQLEKTKPEDFEELGRETMQKCWEVEQAMRICAPKLHAYEDALRPTLQKLRSELARVQNQVRSLHDILYNCLNPVSDAQMLAHTRKVRIVAVFAVLTGIACLVGNVTSFWMMGTGPLLSLLGAIGITALPLGLGHLAYEWILSQNRWLKMAVVLVAVGLGTSGIVVIGQARWDMVDRSIQPNYTGSYVDGSGADDSQPVQRQEPPRGKSESEIRHTLGEGIFLLVLAAELGLAFLVGWLIELYHDPDNTAWRQLQHLGEQLSDLDATIVQVMTAPELAKKCCLAGILSAANSRPRRHRPYHQELTMILVMIAFLLVPNLHAQTIERYTAILIDTSSSISHGGRSNELFREYLAGTKKLLLSEPPNSRVWVLSISGDSFGGSPEILKGWTPAAHGVLTDDLDRARIQLASTFEQRASGLQPVASATDIFGALWRIKAIFESRAAKDSDHPISKSIVIFSDMLNDTKQFPMPKLIDRGPNWMIEQAERDELVVPLNAYEIHICGASTDFMSPQLWQSVREFWVKYFGAADAKLLCYSTDRDYEQ